MNGGWGGSIIAGVAELPPARTSTGVSTLGLIGRVGRRALDDAGLVPANVDGLFVGPQVGETPQHVPATVAEYLGLAPDVVSLVDLGTTAEQLALIAVKERANAQRNPAAVWHGVPITVGDVLASPMIAEPIHLLEAVMPCSGGAAVVVTSADRAPASGRVRLLGAGEKVTHRAVSQMPDLTSAPVAPAARRAFEAAGVTAADVGLWSLYDCYPIMVGMSLEALELCPRGGFGPFVEDRDFSADGDLPLNTHGGQLGCGQADLAGGMSHIVEAVRQLRGEGGARQVPGCAIAVVTGNCATMSEATVLVLEAVP